MMHGEFLRQQSKDPELASQIMYDYRTADIDDVLRAILDFAAKLTKEPSEHSRFGEKMNQKSLERRKLFAESHSQRGDNRCEGDESRRHLGQYR